MMVGGVFWSQSAGVMLGFGGNETEYHPSAPSPDRRSRAGSNCRDVRHLVGNMCRVIMRGVIVGRYCEQCGRLQVSGLR
jgi:hypothetical protein